MPLLPGRRISITARRAVAQQDEVNQGKHDDVADERDHCNFVPIINTGEQPYEANTPGASGFEWDPGLGWAGMEDSDAEW